MMVQYGLKNFKGQLMKQHYKNFLIYLFCLGLFFITTMTAQAQIMQVGQYVTADAQAKQGQSHLLEQTFQVRFPETVETVGGAIRYLLQFSGFKLSPKAKHSCVIQNLLQAPLPEVDRSFGPMTLRQGLKTLAGEPFEMEVNPVMRQVSFRLKPKYQRYMKSSHC